MRAYDRSRGSTKMVDVFNSGDQKLLLYGLLPRICEIIWKNNNFNQILDSTK